MNTTSTVKLNIHQPSKPVGWCDEQGVEHSWRLGPTLTSDPPIQTRECANCGKVQWHRPSQWEDR